MRAWLIILGAIATVAASATALAFVGLPYRPLGVEFLQNDPYAPLAIAAEATGSPNPSQIPNASPEERIVNGDFHILMGAGSNNTTLGDGIDEVTLWGLDFSSDPQFDTFPTSTPLASATLTLTVTPKSLRFASDTIRISGLPEINPAIYEELTQDTASTVELELLDFYSSEDILQALTSRNGQITMVAADDAIVSFARLVLISEASFRDGDPSRVNLSGQVLLQGKDDGTLSGTTINLFGEGEVRTMRSVTTNSDGEFSVDLKPGNYRLDTFQEGWQAQTARISISEDNIELEPMRLLLAGDGICPGADPGDEPAPQIVDVMSMRDRDNPLLFNVDVELDQPGRVWAEYHAAGDEANVLVTEITENSDTEQALQLTQLEPSTPYCFQIFATSEEVSDPDEASQVSDSFPGSFITGSRPPGQEDGASDTMSGQ